MASASPRKRASRGGGPSTPREAEEPHWDGDDDEFDEDDEPLRIGTVPAERLDAVIKLFCQHTEPNYSLPWQMRRQTSSTSTGFVLSGRRLLTNAHCVDNATVVKVKKRASSTKYIAEVLAIGRECDLALLTVDDDDFWKGVTPITLAERLPTLQDNVNDDKDDLDGVAPVGLQTVLLDVAGLPVQERLTQALLECVAAELIAPEANVVALYSGFEAESLDSLSVLRLEEHLGQLTSRDLRNLETKVPLETLKLVVDIAVEIGREGREGKPVGTLFVVGDSRHVMQSSHATGFDPVRGYNRVERKLTDSRVREGIKEIAQLDGAFIVNADGTVEAAARYIDASAESVSVAKGLGARHWAAAAITRRTKSVAVSVSETNGTVRLFQNGEVVLRIEPFRRAMKWKDFEYEPPSGD